MVSDRKEGPAIAGLAFWALALGLALWAQRRLPQADGLDQGTAGFLVAASLAVVASYLLYRPSPQSGKVIPPDASLTDSKTAMGRGARLAVPVAVAGLLALAVSLYCLIVPKLGWHGFAAWCLALALFTAAAVLAWERPALRLPARWREALPEAGVVLGLLVLAAALRLTGLTYLPPDVHGDEAQMGLAARRLLSGEVENPFAAGWFGFPGLSFLPTAVSMIVFGNDLAGIRVASAIQGIITVPLLYVVTKRLFNVRVALVAAVLLALSQWHIHYSRSGLNNIGGLVAELLLFYFFLRGLQRHRLSDFLFAGFALGLCMNTYYAARLAPVFIFLYAAHLALREKGFLGAHWRGFAVCAAGFGIFMVPLIVYYWHNPESLLSRTQGVFLLNPDNVRHALGAYKTDSMAFVLTEQARRSVLAFNLLGETSQQFGYRESLLDIWTGPLFVLGAAVATFRPLLPSLFFAAAWFWLSLVIGSVFTVDAMASPRMIALVPVPFIFAALAVDVGWRGLSAVAGRVGRAAATALLAIFLCLAASANYPNYFEVYPVKVMPATFYTAVSHYVGQVNDRYQAYLIGSHTTSFSHETPRFLIPDVDGVDLRDGPLTLPVTDVPAGKGIVFVIEPWPPTAEQRLTDIRAAYPTGMEEEHRKANGAPGFIAYRVEREDLLAALR